MGCREWKEHLLEDVVDKFIDYRGKTPKKTESGVPLITAKIIKDGFIQTANEFISEGDYLSWMTRGFPQINDVVMTTEAPLGEVAQIKTNDKVALAQRIITMRGKREVLDNTYLKYFLQSNVGQSRLYARATGTTVIGIKSAELKKVGILMPNYYEQRAIATTLSCLDDMIELNNRTNQVLEEMAQAVFRHWFVDFEFPNEDGHPYKSSGDKMVNSELGEIPEGWRVGNIGDYVKIRSGYAFKSSWWKTTGIPVVKIKDIDNFTVNFTDISYVSGNKAELAKDFKAKAGDLLIAMTGATIGKFAIVPTISPFALVNQRVGKFFLGDHPLEKIGFIYCTLKQDNIYSEIVSRGDGSAQPNISPSAIESIKIILPPPNIINYYNQQVMELFKLIIQNISENTLLYKIRNTLLPKLMSGEIRVPVEEVV